MNDLNTGRIECLLTEETYPGEHDCISNAISRMADLSCAALVALLDEHCVAKRELPWEFRRAHRIRRLDERQRGLYYGKYCKQRVRDGQDQVELIRRVTKSIGYSLLDNAVSVLDLGAGRGSFLAAAQQSSLFPAEARFHGIDVDMASLLINQKINDELGHDRYALISHLGERLPFERESFDLIASFSTLEHVGDVARQRQFLSECARCLKKEGLAILRFPNKYNAIRPEEHVGVPLLDYLPTRLKDSVSRFLVGMPSADIYPPSLFQLKRMLSDIPEIGFEIYSQMQFHHNRLARRVFGSWPLKTIGPGFVLVIRRR